MSRKKYPIIGASRPVNKGLCACCDTAAIKRIDVQVSWMRGDDEVFLLCEKHLQSALSEDYVSLFLEAKKTKEKRREKGARTTK